MTDVVLLLAGLLLLYIGAEWLVKGSTGLARQFGIRPFVIGLTLVAYGTSMPEIVVSGLAALEGKSGIALGNVVGSNIANIGLILGLTALIAPTPVERGLVRREIPVLLATALAAPVVLLDGVVSRAEAGVLLLGAAVYTAAALRRTQGPGPAEMELVEADAERAGAPAGGGRARLAAIAVTGLLVLLGGGRMFVAGASGLAMAAGISERIVGLTIVAVGTSAPELASSVVAALRGHPGIAIGNVIGSNICNVLFVLGGAGLIEPIHGELGPMRVEMAALMGFTLWGAWLVRRERRVSRIEGALLAAAYLAFLALAARS